MSITFYSPEAPQIETTYECMCVDCDGRVEPDCYWCNGTGMSAFHTTEHEINVSNGNGMDLMRLMGITPDYCGEVTAEDVPKVLRRLMVLLNGDLDDEGTQTQVEVGEMRKQGDAIGRGPTVIHCGREPGYLTERLTQMQTLFKAAADNGWPVVWG